jgi:hypothetical protein
LFYRLALKGDKPFGPSVPVLEDNLRRELGSDYSRNNKARLKSPKIIVKIGREEKAL